MQASITFFTSKDSSLGQSKRVKEPMSRRESVSCECSDDGESGSLTCSRRLAPKSLDSTGFTSRVKTRRISRTRVVLIALSVIPTKWHTQKGIQRDLGTH